MKIDDISQNIGQMSNVDTSANKRAEGAKKPVQETEKGTQPGAKVDFSNTSVEFSKAAEKMEEVPEERAAKIEELKEKVSDDTYHVDSKKIAEKIIDESLSDILGPK